MPGGLPIKYYNTFSGGLNTIMSASKVSDRESPAGTENVEYVENGLPSKRRGTDLFNSTVDSQVSGLGRLYTFTQKYLLRNSGTQLYYANGSGWTPLAGKTYTSGKNVNYVQIKGDLYTHDGVNSMGKLTSALSLSTPSSGALGKFGIEFSGRHVVSGDPANPTRLKFSSTKSAENFTGLSGTATGTQTSTTLQDTTKTWVTNEFQSLSVTITAGTGVGQVRTISSNTTNTITVSAAWTTTPDSSSAYDVEGGDTLDVSKDDGQSVTGLAKYEDRLIVFKERSVYQLTFDDTGYPSVQLVSAAYGCVSHRSIDNVENDIFFLSPDGIRTLGYVQNIPGVLRTNQISAKIQTEVDNINPLYFEKSSGIYNEKHYVLSFPQGSSTTNNRVIAFNALYGAWSVWTGLSLNCFTEYIDPSTNEEKLYAGDESGGQVRTMFSNGYNDGNAAVASTFYTKQFDFDAFDIRKRILFVDLQVRSLTGTLGIDVIIDGQTIAKMTSLTSSFSGKDGARVFMAREAMFRQSAGSTANLVATDDVRRIKVGQNARTVQVKVYNSAASETFTLMSVAIGYVSRSPFSFDSSRVIY